MSVCVSPFITRLKKWNKQAAYPAHFPKLGEHNDNSRVVLPEHSPEIFCGFCQGSLRSDVGFLLPVGV